jgi:hypothetical protein
LRFTAFEILKEIALRQSLASVLRVLPTPFLLRIGSGRQAIVASSNAQRSRAAVN